VDDAVHVRVCLEDLLDLLLVCNVKLEELGLLARDQLDASDDLVGRVVQVVRDHDLVVSFEEGQRGERSNVAGSTTEAIA
jgi:hypothetical protein